ncbi:hypothetical protein CmeUKMEL1_08770 [Cryptosporidium meleagridis]|uniref:Uncharacterized protein n=1 Tax=Cryptosporidium meleagridis TaxID=93969 RepID=A0A2P4Z0U7_9CRYT|nr:hypothetical protein CmeUKMEL1_08770 [Cryptosporidium meleagridis]
MFEEIVVLSTHISKNLKNANLNILERILIGQALELPVTSSWQLLLILLSDNCYGLSITQDINELFKSKGKIEKELEKSFKFYSHPAIEISSSVLVYPKPEFLEFIFKFIETVDHASNTKYINVSLLINDKRNLVSCNSMIKKMLKYGFVLQDFDRKATPQNQSEINLNLWKATQNLESSVEHFCKSYLIKMVELFNKLADIKKNSIKNLKSKALLYNKICQLLD